MIKGELKRGNIEYAMHIQDKHNLFYTSNICIIFGTALKTLTSSLIKLIDHFTC
jgi:hypothetical protein